MSYTVSRDDTYEITSMVPFADLFNQGDSTTHPNNVIMQFEESKDYTKMGYFVRAAKDIMAGEVLYGNYGAKNNHENLA